MALTPMPIDQSTFADKLAYDSTDGTTNTSGSIVITTDGFRFVVGVHLNSLGQGNYTWRLGESGNTTYLHVMDEAGNPATGVHVYITYLYIDFSNL